MSGTATPYRVALVTGASRGIGAAVCRRLVALGLEVHALARDAARLGQISAETGATAHAADVTDAAAIERIVGGLSVDVLVSNAGVIPAIGRMHELPAEAIERMLTVNLLAPLMLMRAVLPGMLARKRGHIIGIGSVGGHAVMPGGAPYAASKAGLSMALKVLRHELAGSRVRVSEIAPGRVETEIYLEAFGGDSAALRERLYSRRRSLAPEDVAEVVAAALALPERADIAHLELMPTDQAPGGFAFPEAGETDSDPA
jgi:NADP-dependent 3-hydroxy acid dehydrogenase YdfG